MAAASAPAFVSYSRTDAEFALKLAEDLKAAGANVWLDQLDIEPGERWARAVQAALNSAPRVLVILSPASVDSTNVEDEVAFALEKRKKVVPIFYQDCEVPFQLVPFQYVDFRADYARGLGRLLKTLAGTSVSVISSSAVSAAATVSAVTPIGAAEPAEDREQDATEKARFEEERTRKAAEEKARQEELERQRLAAERARQEEEERSAAAEKARRKEEERQRETAEQKARQEELERQRLAAERARQEEEERNAAAEKARYEDEERQRKAAEERFRQEEPQRQRVFAEAARIVEERRQTAASHHSGAETAAASAHLTREHPQHRPEKGDAAHSMALTDDETDALWDAERQKRQKELTKAIVEEWSAHDKVAGERGESEAVSKLRSVLNDWLSKRPSGFESREVKRQERQKAETKKAVENWRLRK